MNKEKIKKYSWYIGGFVLVTFLLYFWLAPEPIPVQVSKAERGLFREMIQAEAKIRAKDRWTVTAFADGDIKQITLKKGDAVKKSEALTELFWDANYVPILAPESGVISQVFRESPGPVRRGEPLVEIVNPAESEVVAELLTTDAVRVETGNPVQVTGWGDSKPLQAQVIRVSKAGFIKPSALGVEEERTEVTSEFIDLPPEIQKRLGHNFHVEVQIEVAQYPNSLMIPTGALFRDQDNWAVYKFENGRAQKTQVEIAARNNESAMISKGLVEGDLVIVYPGDLVKPDAKVKPL